MPDAIPARSCRTVETAVEASGALTRPMPTPAIRKPGSRTVQPDDGLTRLIDHIATAFRARPEASRMRIGTRVDSRPAIGAATNETTLSGRNTQAGLERRQPEDVLQEERQVEEHREHRRRDRERRRLRSHERRPLEEREVDHRRPLAQLRDDEQHEEHPGRHEEADDPRGRPALLVSLDQGEDQAEQAADQRHEPDRVEPAELGVARLAELPRREDDRPDADRDVDEEDPPPREPGGQHAAGERADRDGRADRRAPGAESRAALPPVELL